MVGIWGLGILKSYLIIFKFKNIPTKNNSNFVNNPYEGQFYAWKLHNKSPHMYT